ncbi:MAG: VanW family protein, partial [Lachnospiraceae bacterium]|nr:VanW family protein [Lachnospiraceae bacterium]
MKNKKFVFIPAVLFFALFLFTGGNAEADEPLNVKPGTIASNVSVQDVSLSKKTYDEAVRTINRHYEALMETKLYARGAEEDQEWTETFAELGLYYDNNEAVKDLKQYVLEGSLLKRYKFAKDLERDPVVLESEPVFDESYIKETVLAAVEEWNCEPEESTATYRGGELVINPGVTGHIYDFEDALTGLFKALKESTFSKKGYELVGSYTTKEPILTAEKVEDFTVIGTYTTGYSAPMDQIGRNRETNLIRSTSNMCGHVFAPGETISALAMYGAVTAANGYAQAGTYTSGGHTDEIGGG